MCKRPCYEHNAALPFAPPVDAHGGDLLLADQPCKEQADVDSLLSESLRARRQMRAAQLGKLRVRQRRRTRIIPAIDEDEADAVSRCKWDHWEEDAYRYAGTYQTGEIYDKALLTIVETCAVHHYECGVRSTQRPRVLIRKAQSAVFDCCQRHGGWLRPRRLITLVSL